MDSRDNLLNDLNQTLTNEKLLKEEKEFKIRQLDLDLKEFEFEKRRILCANGALQDALAVSETKINEAHVCNHL